MYHHHGLALTTTTMRGYTFDKLSTAVLELEIVTVSPDIIIVNETLASVRVHEDETEVLVY
jgi:hypothetical protein